MLNGKLRVTTAMTFETQMKMAFLTGYLLVR
jgi:hypothetical protein